MREWLIEKWAVFDGVLLVQFICIAVLIAFVGIWTTRCPYKRSCPWMPLPPKRRRVTVRKAAPPPIERPRVNDDPESLIETKVIDVNAWRRSHRRDP